MQVQEEKGGIEATKEGIGSSVFHCTLFLYPYLTSFALSLPLPYLLKRLCWDLLTDRRTVASYSSAPEMAIDGALHMHSEAIL